MLIEELEFVLFGSRMLDQFADRCQSIFLVRVSCLTRMFQDMTGVLVS